MNLSANLTMSLAVAVKGPEGVVLAVDSRVTLQVKGGDNQILPINFDNATKFLSFKSPHSHFAAVTYGTAVIGLRTAHSFIPEFEPTLGKERLTVEDYANRLSEFYLDQWQKAVPPEYAGPPMNFIVAGYNRDEPYGRVYLVEIPKTPKPNPRNKDDFGMTWGGQLEIMSRIIHGIDPSVFQLIGQKFKIPEDQIKELSEELKKNIQFRIPYDVLPLQDCMDLAIFMIRTTMTAQNLAVGIRGVGGLIEAAYVTRTKALTFVQQKVVKGESEAG